MQSTARDCWGNINFLRTVAGIIKWFWVTIKGYESYLLPKFEDLVLSPVIERICVL